MYDILRFMENASFGSLEEAHLLMAAFRVARYWQLHKCAVRLAREAHGCVSERFDVMHNLAVALARKGVECWAEANKIFELLAERTSNDEQLWQVRCAASPIASQYPRWILDSEEAQRAANEFDTVDGDWDHYVDAPEDLLAF